MPSPWCVWVVSGLLSEGVCESRCGGRSGSEAVPLVRVASAVRTACSGMERDGEAAHPFSRAAAEFIFVADVSHSRAIITVMKGDSAVLGL